MPIFFPKQVKCTHIGNIFGSGIFLVFFVQIPGLCQRSADFTGLVDQESEEASCCWGFTICVNQPETGRNSKCHNQS